jgi:hypothetical protein
LAISSLKKQRLDELAEAHARISSLEQRNSALEARISRDKPNGGKQIR